VTQAAERPLRRGALRRVWLLLRGGELSPTRAALSVFVGLFIGCQPLYGLHLLLCVLVCLPLRLDLVVAYVAANVSNPLVAPFLIMLELEIGAWLVHGAPLEFDLERARQIGASGLVQQTALGAQVVGLTLGLLGALGAYATIRFFGRDKAQGHPGNALSRTIDRYAKVPLKDRLYIPMKLQMDPLTEQLVELDTPLGRVLDIGCGRGQFSLLLWELGLATAIEGFDFDARKVAAAQLAAGSDATFRVGDALTSPFPRVDAVLLFDVLHYLTPEQQRSVLEHAASGLAPGGRLLVRELDKREGWGSAIGQWFEKVATKSGYNRARGLAFRPVRELLAQLQGLGFDCRVHTQRTLWSSANVLVVATRLGPNATADPA